MKRLRRVVTCVVDAAWWLFMAVMAVLAALDGDWGLVGLCVAFVLLAFGFRTIHRAKR